MLKRLTLHLLTAAFFTTLTGYGQYSQHTHVQDGAGITSSSGALTNIAACSQSGGTRIAAGGSFVNMAGYLNTFHISDNDADRDGLVDELDLDNDNDGLADFAEITGVSFNPVTPSDPQTADSDRDGMPDKQESDAGTNPQDANSLLHILSVENTADGRMISWQSRGGYRYEILGSTQISSLGEAPVLEQVTASGGVAPWFDTVSVYTDTAYHAKGYYGVQRVP